jgi:hypothetical protein
VRLSRRGLISDCFAHSAPAVSQHTCTFEQLCLALYQNEIIQEKVDSRAATHQKQLLLGKPARELSARETHQFELQFRRVFGQGPRRGVLGRC